MKMRKTFVSIALLSGPLAFLPGAASAGERVPANTVRIDYANRLARGSMSGARYSADNVQWIGCAFDNAHIGCHAVDANGGRLDCLTTDLSYQAAVAGINEASFISFNVDSHGQCVDLEIGADSAELP